MNLGAHMSIAGGLARALDRGRLAGCNAVQVFTRNQTRWTSPPMDEEDARRFRSEAAGFFAVFAHASYLINLASPEQTLVRRSVTALAEELIRCRRLGIAMLVLHPGAHRGAGEKAGIRRVVEALKTAFDLAGGRDVRVLLETTAGQGSSLGCRFEQLRDMLDGLASGPYPAGICLDTCHIFAAGYDIRDSSAYERTWSHFQTCLGLSSLFAVHLNDSKRELGCRVDRHEHIGRGMIGPDGFRLMVGDARLRHLPMVLETPKGPELGEDRENLAFLRDLRDMPLRDMPAVKDPAGGKVLP
jgi:deoxyribonuclease-4